MTIWRREVKVSWKYGSDLKLYHEHFEQNPLRKGEQERSLAVPFRLARQLFQQLRSTSLALKKNLENHLQKTYSDPDNPPNLQETRIVLPIDKTCLNVLERERERERVQNSEVKTVAY